MMNDAFSESIDFLYFTQGEFVHKYISAFGNSAAHMVPVEDICAFSLMISPTTMHCGGNCIVNICYANSDDAFFLQGFLIRSGLLSCKPSLSTCILSSSCSSTNIVFRTCYGEVTGEEIAQLLIVRHDYCMHQVSNIVYKHVPT